MPSPGPTAAARSRTGPSSGRRMVAQLRAAYGHHIGDPAWTGFIRRMEAASPEFAAMWATQDVAHPHYHAKVFRHPLYPRLEMTSTSFAVQSAPGTRMVVYTPDNEPPARPWNGSSPTRSSTTSPAGPPTRTGPGNFLRSRNVPVSRAADRDKTGQNNCESPISSFATRTGDHGSTMNHAAGTGCHLNHVLKHRTHRC